MRAGTFVLLLVLLASPAVAQQLIDDFAAVDDWVAAPSDGVELRISSEAGGMRLDFDFHGGAGYAIARKPVRMQLPDDYEFAFLLRGDTPPNTLEFKLLDASGESVWWLNQRNFRFPRDWTRMRIKKRHLEFAWGPSGGKPLTEISALEIVITASTGGRGSVFIDDLTFAPRAPRPATYPEPKLSQPAPNEALLDLGSPREFGGLTLDWAQHARDYDVQLSDDGVKWETATRIAGSTGGRDPLFMPDSDARYVRIRAATPFTLRNVQVEPLATAASRNAFFTHVASSARKGLFPRYLGNEQSYWTIVGEPDDEREVLLSEDGALEVDRSSFSIEPFLFTNGRLVTWHDARRTQSLADDYLPIPTVEWSADDVHLAVTAYSRPKTIYARYRVSNPTSERRDVTLFLAMRPFQVNPPWQFLNVPGGTAELHGLAFEKNVVYGDGKRVVAVTPPTAFGATTFASGDITESLSRGALPSAQSVTDTFGAASGALRFDLTLPANGHRDVYIALPENDQRPTPAQASAALAESTRTWKERLDRFTLELPDEANGALIARVVKSNVAYILINQDGPAIQPGSRSYDRSWIRDGSLTSAALLRLGFIEPVRAFAEWYAPFQFPSGKVPCCVDARGSDPVPEHDSHGQLIYLIAETYRHTRDRAFVERLWPHVEKSVAYIESLTAQRMTPEYQTPEKRAFYGMVPESISHEGYSAKPMHSYWDDFFVLRGLEDAAFLAGVLGKDATRYAALVQTFRTNLHASIAETRRNHRIDYIPGSVELGDYDATSTTVALAPGNEHPHLDRAALEATFERYWRESLARIQGKEWEAYTPYETRTIGSFLRLGWRDRAHELLGFFLAHLRPRAWNHWAEVVFRDPAAPKFIGDMPHTWVGSDFIRSVLDMFAYEEGDRLIVGAGVPEAWKRGKGVTVRGLRTHFGTLNLRMQGETVEVTGEVNPPGGVWVDGRRVR